MTRIQISKYILNMTLTHNFCLSRHTWPEQNPDISNNEREKKIDFFAGFLWMAIVVTHVTVGGQIHFGDTKKNICPVHKIVDVIV